MQGMMMNAGLTRTEIDTALTEIRTGSMLTAMAQEATAKM